MGISNPIHIAFIALVALLVLGPKRLPDVARALGNGMREFKQAMGAASLDPHQLLQPQPQQPPAAPTAAAPAPQAATTMAATAVAEPPVAAGPPEFDDEPVGFQYPYVDEEAPVDVPPGVFSDGSPSDEPEQSFEPAAYESGAHHEHHAFETPAPAEHAAIDQTPAAADVQPIDVPSPPGGASFASDAPFFAADPSPAVDVPSAPADVPAAYSPPGPSAE